MPPRGDIKFAALNGDRPRYPPTIRGFSPPSTYKDSGVEWLGEVPEHWEATALKRLAFLKSGESINSIDIEEEGQYPVYGGNGRRGYTPAFTHEGTFALIGRQGALCGNINYAEGRFWASEHAIVITPRVPLATRWLGELLRAMNLNQYSISAAQPGLSVEMVANLRVPRPSYPEQSAIATFLDREIAKIDALVAEYRTLIELLKEKRQAIISHAVTKGLDPTVPMKGSGVEWLGEVPEHWEIAPIKHVTGSFEQGWSPQCEAYPAETQQEWGILKVGCVNGGIFNPGENKKLPDQLAHLPELALTQGDLLVSRANTRELVGSAAIVDRDYPTLMVCDKLYRIRLDTSRCNPRFLARYLSADKGRGQIELGASGASNSMLNIGQSIILELHMPLPPIKEQADVCAYLDRETAKLDALTAEANQAISLLQERRTALISAAVTGKIDLRGLVSN